MCTVLFAIATIICGLGWLTRYISFAAMVYYIQKKGYAPPNDAEIRECTQWVVKQMFKSK